MCKMCVCVCVLLVVVVGGGGVVVNHQIKLLFESCTQLTAVFFFLSSWLLLLLLPPGGLGIFNPKEEAMPSGDSDCERERERVCGHTKPYNTKRRTTTTTTTTTQRQLQKGRSRRQRRNNMFFFPSISPFLEIAPPSPPPTFIYAQKQLYFSFYSPTHTHRILCCLVYK